MLELTNAEMFASALTFKFNQAPSVKQNLNKMPPDPPVCAHYVCVCVY